MTYAEMPLPNEIRLNTVQDVIDLINELDGYGIISTDDDEVAKYFGFTAPEYTEGGN